MNEKQYIVQVILAPKTKHNCIECCSGELLGIVSLGARMSETQYIFQLGGDARCFQQWFAAPPTMPPNAQTQLCASAAQAETSDLVCIPRGSGFGRKNELALYCSQVILAPKTIFQITLACSVHV